MNQLKFFRTFNDLDLVDLIGCIYKCYPVQMTGKVFEKANRYEGFSYQTDRGPLFLFENLDRQFGVVRVGVMRRGEIGRPQPVFYPARLPMAEVRDRPAGWRRRK